MPYEIIHQGNSWVVKTGGKGGKVHGVHSTRPKAAAQLRALYANAPAGEGSDTPQHEKSEPKTERKAEGE